MGQARLQRAAQEQGEIRASAEKKKADKVKEKKEMMAMKASMHRDVDLAQKAQNREAKGPAPKKLTKAEQKQADKKAAEAVAQHAAARQAALAKQEAKKAGLNDHQAEYLNSNNKLRVAGSTKFVKMANWCNAHMDGYQVRGLGDDWIDGCAVLALAADLALEAGNPLEQEAYFPQDAEKNCQRGLSTLITKLGLVVSSDCCNSCVVQGASVNGVLQDCVLNVNQLMSTCKENNSKAAAKKAAAEKAAAEKAAAEQVAAKQAKVNAAAAKMAAAEKAAAERAAADKRAEEAKVAAIKAGDKDQFADMDANGDGNVTREEFDAYQARQAPAAGGSSNLSEWLAANELSEFESRLMAECGVTKPEDVCKLSAMDLALIGMKSPQRQTVLNYQS